MDRFFAKNADLKEGFAPPPALKLSSGGGAAAPAVGKKNLTPSAAEFVPAATLAAPAAPAAAPAAPAPFLYPPHVPELALGVALPFQPEYPSDDGSRGGHIFSSEHDGWLKCADFMSAAGAAHLKFAQGIDFLLDVRARVRGGPPSRVENMQALLEEVMEQYLQNAQAALDRVKAIEDEEKAAALREQAQADSTGEASSGLLEMYENQLRSEGVLEDSADWNAKVDTFCRENHIAQVAEDEGGT